MRLNFARKGPICTDNCQRHAEKVAPAALMSRFVCLMLFVCLFTFANTSYSGEIVGTVKTGVTPIEPYPSLEERLDTTWVFEKTDPYMDAFGNLTGCGWISYLIVPYPGEGIYTQYNYNISAGYHSTLTLNDNLLTDEWSGVAAPNGAKIRSLGSGTIRCQDANDAYFQDRYNETLQSQTKDKVTHIYYREAQTTTIDFVFSLSTSVPGEVSFTATADDPQGRPIDFSWRFGDGGTASGAQVTHQYSTPGDHIVTLRGSTQGSAFGVVSRKVTIEPTRFTANLRFTDNRTDARVPDDENFGVTLDIHSDNGVGGAAAAVEMAFANAPNLEIVSEPDLSTGLALEPNQTVSYDWIMRPLGSGHWRIAATVNGLNPYNPLAPLEAFDALEGSVIGRDLTAEITLTPDRIEVQEEELGSDPIPIEFRADLSVCNNSDQLITNVVLREFRAIPAVAQAFYVEQLTGPAIDPASGLEIGPLSAFSCVSFTATFRADDDNEIEVDTLVTGVSSLGSRLTAMDEQFLSIGPKYLLQVTTEILRPSVDEALLPAGDTIRIGGKVKNLSNTHKILLGPLYPELSGNAGA
ncbi:MAG TPA: PKD domain-containing protein, partial [Gammaproteobacteria bacterium]|nr:PKD domain-containing protein [Gammaproteobacteria bacterium]